MKFFDLVRTFTIKFYNSFKQDFWTRLVIFCLLIYFVVFGFIIFWKYENFLYNGLDLAIFSQSLFNWKDFFYNSIQGQSYFGDHFSILLVLFVPFYKVFSSPMFLLFAQLFFIVLAGWIFWLLCKKILIKPQNAFLCFIFFLGNFLIYQIVLNEFHLLSFVVLGFLILYYAYLTENFSLYIFAILFCLFIREDVALLILGFSILPILEKKKIKWFLLPFLLSIFYFVFSLKVINLFNLQENYKFLVYYGWLGNSFVQIFKNLVFKPYLLFLHFSFSDFETILGLLLSFLFLPILQARFLIVLVFVFLEFFLTANGFSPIILQTHYSALFVGPLLIASIYGLKSLIRFINKDLRASYFLVIVCFIYLGLYFGPFIIFTQKMFNREFIEKQKYLDNFIKKIPKFAKVLASPEFLPQLSQRKNLYALQYVFLGKKQFSNINYEIPKDLDFILLNLNDFKFFYYQFLTGTSFTQNFSLGDDNIRSLLEKNQFNIIDRYANYVLLKNNFLKTDDFIYKVIDSESQNFKILSKNLDIEEVELSKKNYINYTSLDITLKKKENISKDYFLIIKIFNKNQELVFQDSQLVGFGIQPLSDLKKGKAVKLRFLIPAKYKNYKMQISLAEVYGFSFFNSLSSVQTKEKEIKILGSVDLDLAKE